MESHAHKILSSMAQLRACNGDYGRLDAALTAKRLAWWEANQDRLDLHGPLPRQAYTMFLLRCLGLDEREVPVVYEDERKIVWRSFNFCSLLEACRKLGLDTRQVCRAGSEQSVQALLARLDARLRFGRNYADGIRPYADYCEEWIEVA